MTSRGLAPCDWLRIGSVSPDVRSPAPPRCSYETSPLTSRCRIPDQHPGPVTGTLARRRRRGSTPDIRFVFDLRQPQTPPPSLLTQEAGSLIHGGVTPESYNQKNSLFNAMNRFIGAVNNMDQTVMVPSLLRDVPLDDTEDLKAVGPANGFHQDADMYSSYVLLKSIRNDIEWGVLQGEERRKEKAGAAEAAAEDDLEKQFHFHLKGLHAVLSKLTCKANTLTTRYKEEIGCGN